MRQSLPTRTLRERPDLEQLKRQAKELLGQLSLVTLFLDRGADPVERDAEPWATPGAWAKKMNQIDVLAELGKHQPGGPDGNSG